MKVLFLTYSPSPYRVDFFEELGKKVNLTVCFETSPNEDKVKNKRDSSWYGQSVDNYKAIYLKNKKLFSKSISFDLINIIKKEKFDIIVIGGYNSLTAMITMNYLKRKNIPFILSTDGGFKKTNENRIKKLIKKHFISMANYYLSTGENATDYLTYYGANKEKIFVYPFTSLKKTDINKKIISNEEKKRLRNKLGLDDKITFMSIGRFLNIKGFDVLLKACKNLDEDKSNIIIIGDKPTEEYLKIIEEYDIRNVSFIDFKPHEEVLKYIEASDVFILATRGDIWGLVINEALSKGKPVITTKKCGAGLDLIKDGYNGFLINVDDEQILHSKMKYFIENKNEIDRMSINALDCIKEYTIENEAKVHFDIFKKIIK